MEDRTLLTKKDTKKLNKKYLKLPFYAKQFNLWLYFLPVRIK